ncbi:class I SAM-dependent methyltransferase [Sedimentibacter sp. zth1]|uniref:class I SAM-dependent methyltransferase n=1 Tax=Sedimentibacter sp. zth1 TaxID=2816908 RepID=UPI001A90FBD0|nr:class I SAM-dependent methyltransferase [Sedimentibacter sp. zth1]QSX06583.1 class I SAM-dependent methyltransferase [Sedimentibacter sp. zth1]
MRKELIMKEYENSLLFWDDWFSKQEAEKIDSTIEISPIEDYMMKEFALNCENVFDYGTGSGCFLFQCAQHKHIKYGLGIDQSENGIRLANETVKLSEPSKFGNLEFKIGCEDYLSSIKSESFDGIICSNVIDVIDHSLVENILKEFKRIVKKDGLIFIKINPQVDVNYIQKSGCVEFAPNMISKDDNLRICNYDSQYWKKMLGKYFELKYYIEFPYNGAKELNRLFYLQNVNED